MSEHYDDLETRNPEAREGALMAALPAQFAHAKANAPGFARILKDVDPHEISSRKSLAKLPVTRKSDLAALQSESPPLGGLNATPVERLGEAVRLAGADLRSGRARRELVAHRTRPFCRGLPRRRPGDQHLRLPLHACRLDARVGRAGARLHGGPGRDRADRDAGRSDPRAACKRLRRHAVVPQAHRREGRRDEGRHFHAQEGAGRCRVSAAGA